MTTAPAPALPAQMRFASGARERFAGTFKDVSTPLAAFAQQLDLIDIAAGDFTAGVYLHVTATAAGNAAAVTFAADGPFSAVQQVELLDPTGGAFQTYSGKELELHNAAGGYTGQSIPSDSPAYLATTGAVAAGGSFGFILRIPAELFPRDGACALWNGSTAAQFKVRVTLAPSTQIYGVAPTVLPSVRVRVNSHGYQVPAGTSQSGVGFALTPPGGQMYQNVYRQVYQIAGAGQIIIPLTRKGYLLRMLNFIVRDGAGARSNAILNGDWNLKIDNVDVFNGSWDLLRQITWERNRWVSGANVPAGFAQLSWAFDWDGLNGGESRDQYVPTQPGSIIELRTTATAAGSLTILTNDVSVTKEALDTGLIRT
jgi:hypothetical protein